MPLRLLAGGVAYSRVHTGVHYLSDVVIGSILGAGIAAMADAECDRFPPPLGRQERGDGQEKDQEDARHRKPGSSRELSPSQR